MAEWIERLSKFFKTVDVEPTLTRNIVIFGQAGSGKSSIIDMLAGSPVAKVSNDASDDERHSIPHEDGNTYRFWDTNGLNEDQEGSLLPPQVTIRNFLEAQNVNLLIYCIYEKLPNLLYVNYDLVWKIIFREKVPIVLVVTGLEGKDDMDEWWHENQKTIEEMNVSFDGHACITSSKGRGYRYEKKFKDSARRIWKLVKEHCRAEPWSVPSEWPAQAEKEVKEYMIKKYGAKVWPGKILHNIILFGEAGSGKSSLVNMIVGKDVAKVSGTAEGCTFKNEAYIGETTFTIYDTAGLNEGDQGRVPHWEAIRGLYTLIRQLDGVSLLVCCMRGRVRENTFFNWILFNNVICGEKVPIIAVVTGLETYGDPDDWWRTEDNRNAFVKTGMRPKDVGCVVSYQGRQNEYAEIYAKSQAKVRNLILDNYLREPWSKEKDKWFAKIYHNILVTRLGFPSRIRLDYSTRMRTLISELIKATDMEKEDVEVLEATLLSAEKEFRKRNK